MKEYLVVYLSNNKYGKKYTWWRCKYKFTWSTFEQETSLEAAFRENNYSIVDCKVSYFNQERIKNSKVKEVYNSNNKLVGYLVGKHELYKFFDLQHNNLWRNHISKQLFPDEAFFNFTNKTIYIIEKKWQQVSGSVDEKLQTCDFKKKEYMALFSETDLTIAYYYVLNDFFEEAKYDDVRKYISDNGCKYFYYEIPFNELGL